MRLVRLLPEHGVVELADDDLEGWPRTLSELYRPPAGPFVRLNLIASVDGSATGIDGTSNSLTSRVDRLLLKVIRGFSDVVVVGAASVRAEGYRMPRSARLAVVTSTGNLRGHRLDSNPTGRQLLVICPRTAVDRVRTTTAGIDVEIVEVDDENGRVPVAGLIAALTDRSLDRVLCEGGPSLASQVIDAGVADELCLTTAPTLGGGGVRLLETMAERHPATLTGLLVDEGGFLFARWSLSDRGRATI